MEGYNQLVLVPFEAKLHQYSAKGSSIKATWKDPEEVQVTEERERDNDVGENRTYPMEANLKDSNPVQLNYNSVPRNLYNELQMYIEDLLN